MTPTRPSLPVIDVDEPFLIADRVSGQAVLRPTLTAGRAVTAPCPCHPLETVTFPTGPTTLTVVCHACHLAYTAVLRHVAGKPTVAQFTVKDLRIQLTTRRRR